MGGSFKQQQEICKDRWHTKWPAFPTRSFLDRFHSSTLWKTNIARENPHFSFGNTSSIPVHLLFLHPAMLVYRSLVLHFGFGVWKVVIDHHSPAFPRKNLVDEGYTRVVSHSLWQDHLPGIMAPLEASGYTFRKLTCPLKRGHFKRKWTIFQPLLFQGTTLSFRWRKLRESTRPSTIHINGVVTLNGLVNGRIASPMIPPVGAPINWKNLIPWEVSRSSPAFGFFSGWEQIVYIFRIEWRGGHIPWSYCLQ